MKNMRLLPYLGALGIIMGVTQASDDCAKGKVVVEYQLFEVVRCGGETRSTRIQTVTGFPTGRPYITSVAPSGTHSGTVMIETPTSSSYSHTNPSISGTSTALSTVPVPPSGTGSSSGSVTTTVPRTSSSPATSSEAPPATSETSCSTTASSAPSSASPATSSEVSPGSSTSAAPSVATSGTSSTAPASASEAPSSTSSAGGMPSCTPGLQWAYYNLTEAPTNNASSPGQIPFHNEDSVSMANWAKSYFLPGTVLSGQNPTNKGTTDTVTLPVQCGSNTPNIYGTMVDGDSSFMIVQHIGYFHPDKTGLYNFTVPNVDDTVYLWLGDAAVSGFTNGNANNIVDIWGPDQNTTLQYQASAGDYIPIRILFVNAQDCGEFNFWIRDPDGATVVSGSEAVENNQLLFGCEEAPSFDF